jgi:prepilin-type N-terminal cleavage/methylation domain-containing protein
MNKYLLNKKGFTLVELMVVIAIIGILSAVVFVNISSSRSKARDAKRISDIAQIQLALEQYFDRCGVYPESNSLTIEEQGNCSKQIKDFISVIPKDPLRQAHYKYGVSEDLFDYILKAELENTGNGATTEGLSAPATSANSLYGVSGPCAPSTINYCVGPK